MNSVQAKGNPVKFRNGPAAVTGDESCIMSLFYPAGLPEDKWEDAAGKWIRKSEDLPGVADPIVVFACEVGQDQVRV